jgi:glutathione synthase/RimK-type ligase-like ATP-grasp enzyme
LADLAKIGAEIGIEVVVFVPGSLKTGRGYRFDQRKNAFVKADVSIPDVMYRRSGGFGKAEQVASKELSHLQALGILFTLPRLCCNKWYLYRLFKKDVRLRPHLPQTYVARSAKEVFQTLVKRRDVYVKPLCRSRGDSIYHIEFGSHQGRISWQEVEVADQVFRKNLRGAEFSRRTSSAGLQRTSVREFHFDSENEFCRFWRGTGLRRCIVQDAVPLPRTAKGEPMDFRWLVQSTNQGPVITARVARLGLPDAVTTNIHTGGRAMDAKEALKLAKFEQTEEILRSLDAVAESVYHRLHKSYGEFGEIGIDLAVGSDKRVVLFEVNPTPGRRMLRSISKETREMSLTRLLEYASFRAGFDGES